MSVTDVGTTPRKPLTPTQRLKMFEDHKGICVLCETPIRDPNWIDEHCRALVLGGSNEMSNRGPAHTACADAKTNGPNGDIAMGAKAKRRKIAQLIGKTEPAKKIESAPMPTVTKARKNLNPYGAPRPMFCDQ